MRRDFPNEYDTCVANLREIIEYGALFYGESSPAVPTDATGLPDDLEAKHKAGTMTSEIAAWAEAHLADEVWPPRIPLALIGPTAGALHGFIHPHRQGDICRVAIHNPLHAEVTGFQYRSNRVINPGVVDATAGLVVEHDHGSAWSGMLFHPVDELAPATMSLTDSVEELNLRVASLEEAARRARERAALLKAEAALVGTKLENVARKTAADLAAIDAAKAAVAAAKAKADAAKAEADDLAAKAEANPSREADAKAKVAASKAASLELAHLNAELELKKVEISGAEARLQEKWGDKIHNPTEGLTDVSQLKGAHNIDRVPEFNAEYKELEDLRKKRDELAPRLAAAKSKAIAAKKAADAAEKEEYWVRP